MHFVKMPLILVKSSVQARIKIALVFPHSPSHRMPSGVPRDTFSLSFSNVFTYNVNSYLSLMERFMPSKGRTSQWSILHYAVWQIFSKVRRKTICEFVLWATLTFSYSTAKAKLASWLTQVSFNLDTVWNSDTLLITS